jgi:FkbM family methyltransferase
MSANEWAYALWVNLTNPYRLLFGKRKGGFIWVTKKGNLWSIKSDGFELYSPTPRFSGVSLYVFERRFEAVLKVAPGDIVMDVGAAIGDTSVVFAKKVGPKGFTIAVEPEPKNIECLRLNMRKYPSEIITKAAWDKKEVIKFHINPTVCGHSIFGLSNDIGTIEVQADTIDNMAAGRRIDFLKIDVQGAELHALRGATDVLSRVPKVVVETHYNYGENTCPAVVEFLKSVGFQVRTTPQLPRSNAPDIVHAFR